MAAKGQPGTGANAILIHSVPGPDGGSARSRPGRETLHQPRRATYARRGTASELRRERCANGNPSHPAPQPRQGKLCHVQDTVRPVCSRKR